jgi:uncharacterized protein (TIGR02246 family)
MKRSLWIALVFLWAGLAPAQAEGPVDDALIRDVISKQEAAWNAGDGQAYALDLAADASFTNLFGMVFYGKPAFAARHQEILTTFYKGTRKTHVVRRIRFITPDVAIVDIDNELSGVKTMPAGIAVPTDGILRTQLMEVLVRRGDRWLVEAYHNVDVKPRP